jgi:opacity protein-like surface antigen
MPEMKNKLLLFVLIAFCLLQSPVQAAEYYVSGSGGVSLMQNIKIQSIYSTEDYTDTYQPGSGAALFGAVGSTFGQYRFEGELGYQRNNFNSLTFSGHDENNILYTDASYAMKGHVTVSTIMANGYYDIPLDGKIKLYVTAGIGGARVSYDNIDQATQNYNYSVKKTILAYQIGTGFMIPVANNVQLDIRYRYFATPDYTLDWGYKGRAYPNHTNIENHTILLGMNIGL